VVAPAATFGAGPHHDEPAVDLELGSPTGGLIRRDADDEPATKLGVDSQLSEEHYQPASKIEANTDMASQRFEATLPLSDHEAQQALHAAKPATMDPFGGSGSSIDFGALDFDLGSSKLNLEPNTGMPVSRIEPSGETLQPPPSWLSSPPPPVVKPQPEPTVAGPTTMRGEAPTIPDLDLSFPTSVPPTPMPPGAPTVSGYGAIPQIDLNLSPPTVQPSRTMTPPPMPPALRAPPPAIGPLEEALSRPTLLGGVGALPDETAPRLTSNTDQATVPLIDFDLTGADLGLSGRKTETQAGSPLAAQMATKLDLARGYIDLGVKDGARELLEEVMRDGTREQRQQAVDLIKMVDA
jgi:FimV-like protein